MPCNVCNDQGYKKITNAQGFEEYTICDCHKGIIDKRILVNKLLESGVPKHFWSYELQWYKDEFKKLAPSRERDKLISYIDAPEKFKQSGMCLWLFSNNVKSYKTSLAIQLGKELMIHDKVRVKFLQFRKLMDLFIDFDNKRSLMQNYLNTNFIIIDDMFNIDRAPVKEYQAVNLYGFLDDAIGANIQIICTSNNSLETYQGSKLFGQTASLLYYNSIQLNLPGV